MNSRISVDAEDELHPFGESDDDDDEPFMGFEDKAQSSMPGDDSKGNVVLVLPPKDNVAAHSSTSDECTPFMVNNVPVFISHTGSGSPLYIRQYPPSLEEIMVQRAEDLHVNFDGFSDTSNQNFEGFSEASCSSVFFEGFSEDMEGDPSIPIFQTLLKSISGKGPSGVHTQRKRGAVTSRGSGSHKRKRTRETDLPDSNRSKSSTAPAPRKRVKQESVTGKTENSRSVTSNSVTARRRSSIEKHEGEPGSAGGELMCKRPRKLPSPGDADYIGEYCNAVGCTVSFLERMSLKDVKINNGVVQELSDFAIRIFWEKEFVVRWIQRLSGLKTVEPIEDDDLRSIQAVLKRRKAISIIHSGNQFLKFKLKAFDQIDFVLPSVAKQQQQQQQQAVEKEVKCEDSEIASEISKDEQMAAEEKEQGETRKAAKKVSDAKENDRKCDVTQQGSSGATNVMEEKATDEVKTEESSEVEREAATKKGRETDKINTTTKTEVRISTRRSSMLASREEKEKGAIKQEAADEVTKVTSVSRVSTRRQSIALKDSDKEERDKREYVHGETKSEGVSGPRVSTRKQSIALKEDSEKQEGDKREDACGAVKTKAVSGRIIGTRRQSIALKEDSEKQEGDKKEDAHGEAKSEAVSGQRVSTRRLKEDSEKQVGDKREDARGAVKTEAVSGRIIGTRKQSIALKEDSEKLEGDKREDARGAVKAEAVSGRIIGTRRQSIALKEDSEKHEGDKREDARGAVKTGAVSGRIIGTRRQSMALKEDSEKQEGDRRDDACGEVKIESVSGQRVSTRGQSIALKEDSEEQEGDKREDAHEEAKPEAVPERKISSRRASMLKIREEKERAAMDREARQTLEKAESTKNSNQRQRRESDKEVKPKENKQQEKEAHPLDRNEAMKECKILVTRALDIEMKVADEQKKYAERREGNASPEKHNKKSNNSAWEVTVERRSSSRRERMLAKQEKEKQTAEAEEATQTQNKTKEIVCEEVRSKREKPVIKQEEVKQEMGEEKQNEATCKRTENASTSEKGASEIRRSSRRESILTSIQQEGKPATKGEVEKDVPNKTTSLKSGRDKKRHKTREAVREGIKSNRDKDKETCMKEDTEKEKLTHLKEEVKTEQPDKEKEKQTRTKEETRTEQGKSQSSKERSAEGEPAHVSTAGEKDKAKKAEEHKITGKEESMSEDDQFMPRRNKVINRDKRISRWQNKKMAQNEDSKPFDTDLSPKKDLTGSSEQKDQEDTQPTSSEWEVPGDDSIPSDDESEANLVIDESDDNMQIDEGISSMQSSPSDDMSRENEGLPQSKRKKKQSESPKEKALAKRVAGSTRDRAKKLRKGDGHVEREVGKVGRAKPSIIANGDLTSKETTPQDATPPSNNEATPQPLRGGNTYSGTLGVSKSGRLRKPSAKGIQSIEIKCLFMERNCEAPRPPPPLPVSKDDQMDEDWVHDKRSPVKREPKDKDMTQDKKKNWLQDNKSVIKNKYLAKKVISLNRGYTFTKTDNDFLTYTRKDGHLIPKFKDTDYYLGDHCARAGLTVEDLNSENGKKIKMTFGMIKELHDFYVSRKCTKTALAIRLFKLQHQKPMDYTHLLSTVMRITHVAKLKFAKNVTLDKEFVLPVRVTLDLAEDGNEKPSNTQNLQNNNKASKKSSPESPSPPRRVRRSPKKRGAKPADSGGEEEDFDGLEEDEDEVYRDVLLTCGQEGAITRGDIVNLYSKWLKSKMSEGSNTFVTDLLRSVEQLMAERQVAPLRIPAGTLMSSSVKLHDEYRQILRISKEDAIMYLQEDWLEDIKYLLSVSAPSRRNTSEGEPAPGCTLEDDIPIAVEKHSKPKTPRHRSGGDKEDNSKAFEGEPPSNTSPFKSTATRAPPRSHQMESVGKRLAKRRNVRESLDNFEKDILLELEKAGVLEEDEEDTLQQLDHSEQSDEDELQEEKKKERKMKSLEEKSSGKNKDRQEVVPTQKNGKPVDDGDFDLEVQKIVDYQEVHDKRGNHFRYLVRWVGFGPQDDSWVDEANLMSPGLIKAFWKRKKSVRQDTSEPPTQENYETHREAESVEPESLAMESKEEEESIIQVMVKHGSAQDTVNTNSSPIVTKRELLSLYDAWRQENQEELMADGSNTINVGVFKDRVGELMASRGIKFYPESLLNACFMMTLMKTRLQSSLAINKFLDTSCLEVLESSQRQYLKSKYFQIEDVLSSRHLKEKPSVLNLQNELRALKLDLTTAQKWRAVKNSQLGAVEEEVDCLETADNSKITETLLHFSQELHQLKCDLEGLERKHSSVTSGKATKTVEVPLFSSVGSDSEGYKTGCKMVRDELINMSMRKSTVDTIMDIVARRVAGQCVQE